MLYRASTTTQHNSSILSLEKGQLAIEQLMRSTTTETRANKGRECDSAVCLVALARAENVAQVEICDPVINREMELMSILQSCTPALPS